MNRIQPLSISLGQDVSALAYVLRHSVVRVGGGAGPGGGSGVILSPDGLIATNAHVATSEKLRVEVGGRKMDARLIARNPGRDLALMKVDASGLKPLAMRDLSTLRTGETVLALGFPMGDDAVTLGIVHAVPRDGHWLTADIRVAPGNSGGPLCDVQGKLVGINTMVVDGLTLAISARAIERFVGREMKYQANAVAAV